ncbi:hypothetical protein RvY_18463 [Ramazzottius varieornatus]|uniref:Prefoldin subunit 2 n=1 Tax=Ramazzottius varieornatus TaxID=947166 RepID=A0A1D1W5U8_RAMVA|nr:hypothetical protein RvY_18463 [Ramazzottius varieornatus]
MAEGSGDNTKKDTEQIVSIFSRLRQEQGSLSDKLAELEADLSEHTLVLQMMEKLEPERKCFRRVGGVLVERTVAEFIPAISDTKTQISNMLVTMREQLESKTKELQEYKKLHKIVVRGVDAPDMTIEEMSAVGSA